MRAPWTGPASRRCVLTRGLAGGLAVGLGLAGSRAAAEGELFTVSGGGVNLKLMPSPDGAGTVPMRESFAFDAHYAQCLVEDNADRFAMDTFGMGRVVIEPHTFFMAMYANEVSLVGIYDLGGGKRVVRLTGALDCATEAGTATATVGSRTATETAFYDIEATDGGHGGGAAGDSFAFTVYFDAEAAPVNYGIFGPEFTFTGELIAGEVTIAPAVALPAVTGPPPAATPAA